MRSIESELETETKKWLKKLEEEMLKIKEKDPLKAKEFIKNINAYILDSKYFLKKGDLIRAFECVVWAWAWLEIGLNLNVLKKIR